MSQEKKLNPKEKKEEKLEVRLNVQEIATPLKPVADWTKEDVQKWLKENGLKETELKEFERINGSSLLEVKEEVLIKLLGLVFGGVIFNRISQLKEGIFKF